MNKYLWIVTVAVLAAVLLPVLSLALMSLLSPGARGLGVTDGKLADCPASPNCVCTQASAADRRMEPIPFDGTAAEAKAKLVAVLTQMPRARIVTDEEQYLHVEFTSLVFRYVDDVQFLIDPDAQVIHFRSASRAGHSDLGVNRQRMEELRRRFTGG